MMASARELAAVLAEILTLVDRVEVLIGQVTEPAFDVESDAPLNPAGAVEADLQSLLDEELRPATRRVAALLARHLPRAG